MIDQKNENRTLNSHLFEWSRIIHHAEQVLVKYPDLADFCEHYRCETNTDCKGLFKCFMEDHKILDKVECIEEITDKNLYRYT